MMEILLFFTILRFQNLLVSKFRMNLLLIGRINK